MEMGIPPLSEFRERYRNCIFVAVESPGGIVPINLLLCKFKSCIPGIEDNTDGIVPLKQFDEKSIFISADRLPMLCGMVPVIPFDAKSSPTMWPFTSQFTKSTVQELAVAKAHVQLGALVVIEVAAMKSHKKVFSI
jgi:hypothetical protein